MHYRGYIISCFCKVIQQHSHAGYQTTITISQNNVLNFKVQKIWRFVWVFKIKMGIIISVILRVILTSFCCKHHHKLWEKQDGPKKNGPNKSKGKRPQINNSPLNNYVTKKWPEENHKNHWKKNQDTFYIVAVLIFQNSWWWFWNILPSFSRWHLTPFFQNILCLRNCLQEVTFFF